MSTDQEKPCAGQQFSWEQDTGEYNLADLQAALGATAVPAPEVIPKTISPAYHQRLKDLAQLICRPDRFSHPQ